MIFGNKQLYLYAIGLLLILLTAHCTKNQEKSHRQTLNKDAIEDITQAINSDPTLQNNDGSSQQSDKTPGNLNTLSPETKDNLENEFADLPNNTTGFYLTCTPIDKKPNQTSECLGCRIEDKDHNQTELQQIAKKWEWSYESQNDLTINITDANKANSEWHVIYEFSNKGGIKNSDILDVTIKFNYESNDDGKNYSIEDKITKILKGIEKHTHVRLVFDSIQMADPTRPITYLETVEILIEDKWELLKVHTGLLDSNPPATSPQKPSGIIPSLLETISNIPINESGPSCPVTVGPYYTGFKGTLGDVFMLAGIIKLIDFDWSIGTSYSNSPPYDAKAEPMTIQISFDQPRSVRGIRFNGGQSLTGKNLVSGVPDRVHLDVSKDGNSWQFVPFSEATKEEYIKVIDKLWSTSN